LCNIAGQRPHGSGLSAGARATFLVLVETVAGVGADCELLKIQTLNFNQSTIIYSPSGTDSFSLSRSPEPQPVTGAARMTMESEPEVFSLFNFLSADPWLARDGRRSSLYSLYISWSKYRTSIAEELRKVILVSFYHVSTVYSIYLEKLDKYCTSSTT